MSKSSPLQKDKILPESPCGTEISSLNDEEEDTSTPPNFKLRRLRSSTRIGSFGDTFDIVMEAEEGIEFHGLARLWTACLGISGALDIAATLLPSVFLASDEENKTHIAFSSPSLGGVRSVVSFLSHHQTVISFSFSLLCFFNAFVDAQYQRQKVDREKERIRSLRTTTDVSNPSLPHGKEKRWWQTTFFVYYRTMVFQLLFLPVGFYLLLFFSLERLIVDSQPFVNLAEVNESVTLAVSNADKEIEYEHFSITSGISVLFAILHHVCIKISGSTARLVQQRISDLVRKFRPAAIKNLLSRAIRNPMQFRRQALQGLRILRWIKYLAPLIGTLNKLNANVQDYLKKRRQRIIADKQRRVREILWGQKPARVRKEEAAIVIQSTFRASRTRKAANLSIALRSDIQYMAAMKVQRAFKLSLARARNNLRDKRWELKRLSTLKHSKVDEPEQKEKRRFYELQEELGVEAQRLINKTLLMRPNTRFSAQWKALFIMCIAFEIIQLMFMPWFGSHSVPPEGMTTSEFITTSLTPTKASQRDEFGYHPKKEIMMPVLFSFHRDGSPKTQTRLPWYCTPPGSTIQEAYSDLVSLLLIPAPVSEWPDCKVPKRRFWYRNELEQKRWFCNKPFSRMHAFYRKIVAFFTYQILVFVSVVCFLDVFVTFFTGEIDQTTGKLSPKPFFARWIAPGVMLQLLVNPQLCALANLVSDLSYLATRTGPIRVFRWCATTLFPFGYFLWTFILKRIWIPSVKHENDFENCSYSMFCVITGCSSIRCRNKSLSRIP